jgi:hypothetical protein
MWCLVRHELNYVQPNLKDKWKSTCYYFVAVM